MIREMPEAERPREKIFSSGVSSLSNTELVAVLIGSGTKHSSALDLAARVLAADRSGILFLRDASPEELCTVKGIGTARAAVLLAAAELGRRIMTAPRKRKISVSTPEDTAAIFMEDMRYLKKEHFRVLLLNVKNEIISVGDVSVGSISSSEAHPREVFAEAVRRGAANVILIHNHPSGTPAPSRADIELTKRLYEAGVILGIQVLDHIIIGDGIFVSMKREGIF
ncbi:MAG: DNA repair protein RadC [Eubacteriales bacterium]|nr:DNA repair protein RadC [Eubacteriales bacterium]